MANKCILSIAAAVLATATAALAWGSLVSSFNSPRNYPGGLGLMDATLYIACTEDDIFRTTTTGSVLGSYKAPNWHMGLDVGKIGSTSYCWVVAGPLPGPDYIYRLAAATGSIYGSFLAIGAKPNGLSLRDSQTLYFTDTVGKVLYEFDPITGSFIDYYEVDFQPGGLSYDRVGYLWIVEFYNYYVHKCTTTGSSLGSFSTQAYGSPKDCAFDGTYLWVSVTGGEHPNLHHLLLQFEVGYEPAVIPASLGKVKALYR